jgi:hypothetical protein
MVLAQREASVDSSWPKNQIVLGIGAIFGPQHASSEKCSLSGRSLHSRLTRLAFLGAIERLGHLRE